MIRIVLGKEIPSFQFAEEHTQGVWGPPGGRPSQIEISKKAQIL
jgi:hypothetical protein